MRIDVDHESILGIPLPVRKTYLRFNKRERQALERARGILEEARDRVSDYYEWPDSEADLLLGRPETGLGEILECDLLLDRERVA